jgi:hypothetical protein
MNSSNRQLCRRQAAVNRVLEFFLLPQVTAAFLYVAYTRPSDRLQRKCLRKFWTFRPSDRPVAGDINCRETQPAPSRQTPESSSSLRNATRYPIVPYRHAVEAAQRLRDLGGDVTADVNRRIPPRIATSLVVRLAAEKKVVGA